MNWQRMILYFFLSVCLEGVVISSGAVWAVEANSSRDAYQTIADSVRRADEILREAQENASSIRTAARQEIIKLNDECLKQTAAEEANQITQYAMLPSAAPLKPLEPPSLVTPARRPGPKDYALPQGPTVGLDRSNEAVKNILDANRNKIPEPRDSAKRAVSNREELNHLREQLRGMQNEISAGRYQGQALPNHDPRRDLLPRLFNVGENYLDLTARYLTLLESKRSQALNPQQTLSVFMELDGQLAALPDVDALVRDWASSTNRNPQPWLNFSNQLLRRFAEALEKKQNETYLEIIRPAPSSGQPSGGAAFQRMLRALPQDYKDLRENPGVSALLDQIDNLNRSIEREPRPLQALNDPRRKQRSDLEGALTGLTNVRYLKQELLDNDRDWTRRLQDALAGRSERGLEEVYSAVTSESRERIENLRREIDQLENRINVLNNNGEMSDTVRRHLTTLLNGYKEEINQVQFPRWLEEAYSTLHPQIA